MVEAVVAMDTQWEWCTKTREWCSKTLGDYHLSVECPQWRGPTSRSPAGSCIADMLRPAADSDRPSTSGKLYFTTEPFSTAEDFLWSKPLLLQGWEGISGGTLASVLTADETDDWLSAINELQHEYTISIHWNEQINEHWQMLNAHTANFLTK